MKTDIQIAQESTMLPIKDVAANYGITEDDLELYGKYKAKFSDEFMNSLDEKPATVWAASFEVALFVFVF